MTHLGSLGNDTLVDYMTGGSQVGEAIADATRRAQLLEEHRRTAAASKKMAIGMVVLFGVAFAAMFIIKSKDDRDYRKGRGIYKRR